MKAVAFENREFYRLIPSRFPPVSVYEGLVANDRLGELAEAENRTNPRLQAKARLLQAYPDSSSPKLQNWNLAPFKYINPEGSRFFGPTRPALELADGPQTALAVAAARRQIFLLRTKEPPTGLDMRMLRRPVTGQFIDFRDYPIGLSRDERWKLGSSLDSGVDGVIFHPPERPSATCVAVLRGDALGTVIQTVHYRFVWNGERISTIYSFDEEGKELLPEELRGPDDTLAA